MHSGLDLRIWAYPLSEIPTVGIDQNALRLPKPRQHILTVYHFLYLTLEAKNLRFGRVYNIYRLT